MQLLSGPENKDEIIKTMKEFLDENFIEETARSHKIRST